jgi:hypothetical protein
MLPSPGTTASSAVNVHEVLTPPKDPVGHRVRANERSSPNHDAAAAAYRPRYFQRPLPVAPILPTSHSQTTAPLIPRMRAIPIPRVGVPCSYSFTHVRGNNVHSTYPIHTAPYFNHKPNHPSVIEEQLALQTQMDTSNNHATLSNSTFSPSSTPFPGPAWAFLQASRAFGVVRPRFDSTATLSTQSSPSHQPVSLPFSTCRIKRRRASAVLRVQSTKWKIKPPPRVDSMPPRDTSPESYSSHEESAEVAEKGNLVNVIVFDDGAGWVADDEDEEDEEDDLESLRHLQQCVPSPERTSPSYHTPASKVLSCLIFIIAIHSPSIDHHPLSF